MCRVLTAEFLQRIDNVQVFELSTHYGLRVAHRNTPNPLILLLVDR